MTKIQIIGTRAMLAKTVRVLHRAGVVQIEERLPTVDPLLLDADAARQREEISALLTRLDALLSLLPKRPQPKNIAALYEAQAARPASQVLDDAKHALAQLDAPAQDLVRRHDQLEADHVTLPRYAKTMRQLTPLAAELAPLKNYETVALLVERKFSAVIEMLRQQLPALTNDQFELVARNIEAETTAAILVFPREHSAAIHSLLGRESITQVRLPDELTNVPFKVALATIEQRLATIRFGCERRWAIGRAEHAGPGDGGRNGLVSRGRRVGMGRPSGHTPVHRLGSISRDGHDRVRRPAVARRQNWAINPHLEGGGLGVLGLCWIMANRSATLVLSSTCFRSSTTPIAAICC